MLKKISYRDIAKALAQVMHHHQFIEIGHVQVEVAGIRVQTFKGTFQKCLNCPTIHFKPDHPWREIDTQDSFCCGDFWGANGN